MQSPSTSIQLQLLFQERRAVERIESELRLMEDITYEVLRRHSKLRGHRRLSFATRNQQPATRN